MTRVRQEILAACLSALLLSGCSPPGPVPPKLATNAGDAAHADTATDTDDAIRDRWSNATNTDDMIGSNWGKKHHGSRAHADIGGAKRGSKDKKLPLSETLEYKNAVSECDALATKQTMGSILTIVTRMRPGAYTAAYVACMKRKGYAASE